MTTPAALSAAAIGLGGLGRYLIDGLGAQDYPQVRAGALLVAGLALAVELLLAALQRLTDPTARAGRRSFVAGSELAAPAVRERV